MSSRQTEERIRRAFENAAPNDLEHIMKRCREGKEKVIIMESTPRKRNGALKRALAAAAALVMVIAGGAVYTANYGVRSVVSLDVNPSIELGVSRGERVVSVEARNEDAAKVIGDMKLKGSDLDVAVNAIIGSMLREGYISEMANSILISVDDDDPQKGAELQARLSAEVKDMLDAGSFKGAVLSQTISGDPETKRLAEQYGITEGKAQLIRQITEGSAVHTFEELAGLSVNELNLIGKSGGRSIENVASEGSASDSAYIGEARAKQAALKHAGVEESEISEYEFEMDYENGKMVYELEFCCNGSEMEYEIDAKTGEIIKSRSEEKNKAEQKQQKKQEKQSAPDNGEYIGEDAARSIALENAKVGSDSISGYKCRLERENGRMVYEIDFKSGGFEYEYEIDAVSGSVLKQDREKED